MPETVRGGPGLMQQAPRWHHGIDQRPDMGPRAVYLLLLEWILPDTVWVGQRQRGKELSPSVQRPAAAAGPGGAPAARQPRLMRQAVHRLALYGQVRSRPPVVGNLAQRFPHVGRTTG